MTTTINFPQIRLDHDLRAVVEQYLGKPQRNGKWLCPFHAENTPSFTVKGDRFRCFGTCGLSGDVTDFVALMDKTDVRSAAQRLGGYLLDLGLSKEEIRAKQAEIRAEYQKRQQQRQEEERLQREQAIARVAGMSAKVNWYHSLVSQARDYWHGQGLSDGTIERYRLGYCPSCPTYRESPSYVIPYFYSGSLVSIRHRLANPNGCGKYRPEFTGLPNQLFNTDQLKMDSGDEIPFGLLEPGQVLLVEGEVKSIYLSDVVGLPAVGVPGASAWQDEWLPLFNGISTVFVVFDPGTENLSQRTASKLSEVVERVLVVNLPVKPDDWFVVYHETVSLFMKYLSWGRIVR